MLCVSTCACVHSYMCTHMCGLIHALCSHVCMLVYTMHVDARVFVCVPVWRVWVCVFTCTHTIGSFQYWEGGQFVCRDLGGDLWLVSAAPAKATECSSLY